MKNKLIFLFFILSASIKMSDAQQQKVASKNSKNNEATKITNPVYEEITFNNEGTAFSEYKIYDTYGKQVRQGWFLNTISVKQLQPGNYVLLISAKGKEIKKEFLKLKNEDKLGMLK